MVGGMAQEFQMKDLSEQSISLSLSSGFYIRGWLINLDS